MGGLKGEGARAVPKWAVLGEESPLAAALVLAEIVGTYRARREADWRELCRGPLEAAVGELTSEHGPRRLEPDQAGWLKRMMARFGRLFPDVWDSVRLCGAGYGIEVVVGTLASAEVSAEAWQAAGREGVDPSRELIRWFADARDERVRAYRESVKRDLTWVV